MTDTAIRLTAAAGTVVASTVAGYACQRLKWAGDRTARVIMTFVGVLAYPMVGGLSIWGTTLQPTDIGLPLLASAHIVAMTFLALALARFVTHDRAETGLFAIAGGTGNNGFTMGAFVLYLLYGEPGMGLSNVYILLFTPTMVLLLFPLAQHYSDARPTTSMRKLIVKSLFDWRSAGLPVVLLGIVLSAMGVPRPPQFVAWHVLDVLVFTITPMAFFAIGLLLHLSRVRTVWRMLAGLAGVRFALGAAVGLILAWIASWTPLALHDLRCKVYVVQAFVPTSVTMVALANMFHLRPREASALFVVNTGMYLLLVVPVVLWLFG
jgi:predicted permease